MKNQEMEPKNRKITHQIYFFTVLIVVVVYAIFIFAKKDSQSAIHKAEVVATPQPTVSATPEPTPRVEKKVTYKKGKLLSKHTTNNVSSYGNRNVNLKVAAKIINTKKKSESFKGKGYLLMPKKTFSWLKTIGKPTEKKGFKYAGVIVNRRPATGIAGGYCQNATSLNTASIKAGLSTIAQKHSVKPSYLTSEDIESTISYDSQVDLKITNKLKYPVIIKQIAKGGSVTTKVYKAKKIVKYVEY